MNASQSIEDQWLSEISKAIRIQLTELVKGSKESGWPNHLENAVSNIEAALDDISRRRDDLDEGQAAA